MRRNAILSLVGIGLAFCGGGRTAENAAKDNADAQAVVQGNTKFSFQLYERLRGTKGNLFLSPYSISTALGMTYAGARGETAEQMAKTLDFTLPADRLHPAFAKVFDALNRSGKKRGFQLHVANALWAQTGYPFRADFLKLTHDDYGADCQEVDFAGATEKARRTINRWVEKKTQERIKELFKSGILNADNRLVLTNAISFKAAWEHPFAKSATKKEVFHLAGNQQIQDVPMMHQTEDLRYYAGGNFQLLDLPYQHGALSMVVLLPRKADGLRGLEKALSGAQLLGWLKEAKMHQVTLSLPRFKVTSEFRLSKVLADMGMKLAFTPRADFSGMTRSQQLMISAVVHKAFVAVDENGTEAAAATGVGITLSAARQPPPKATFRADHPFLFVIVDHQTGSLLFMGRVTNPRQ